MKTVKKPIFIAEIKTQSMFGFKSLYGRETLINQAVQHGDWVAVHTDPRFGGSFDDIYQIRKMTKKPILAKGFHTHEDDIKKAFDLGADYVLTVDTFLKHSSKFVKEKMLYEFSRLDDFEKTAKSVGDYFFQQFKIVYNGRDLRSGFAKKSIAGYHKFRELSGWLCGASLIRHYDQVQHFYPNCDAFIVGENLIDVINTINRDY